MAGNSSMAPVTGEAPARVAAHGHEVGEDAEARPRPTSRGGTARPTPAPLGGGHDLPAVVTRGHGVGRQLGRIGVDEVHPRHRGDPGQEPHCRRRGGVTSWFHCIWGRLTPAGNARTVPFEHTEPRDGRRLLGPLVEQLEPDADAEERHLALEGVVDGVVEARGAQRLARSARRRPPRAAPRPPRRRRRRDR